MKPRITIDVPRTVTADEALQAAYVLINHWFPNDAMNADDYVTVQGFSRVSVSKQRARRNEHITDFVKTHCIISPVVHVESAKLYEAYAEYYVARFGHRPQMYKKIFTGIVMNFVGGYLGGASRGSIWGVALKDTIASE